MKKQDDSSTSRGLSSLGTTTVPLSSLNDDSSENPSCNPPHTLPEGGWATRDEESQTALPSSYVVKSAPCVHRLGKTRCISTGHDNPPCIFNAGYMESYLTVKSLPESQQNPLAPRIIWKDGSAYKAEAHPTTPSSSLPQWFDRSVYRQGLATPSTTYQAEEQVIAAGGSTGKLPRRLTNRDLTYIVTSGSERNGGRLTVQKPLHLSVQPESSMTPVVIPRTAAQGKKEVATAATSLMATLLARLCPCLSQKKVANRLPLAPMVRMETSDRAFSVISTTNTASVTSECRCRCTCDRPRNNSCNEATGPQYFGYDNYSAAESVNGAFAQQHQIYGPLPTSGAM